MPAAQDKVNKKAVGKRIRSRRLDLGLQQVSVADSVGVKAHHLLRWEKGEYLPKADRHLEDQRPMAAERARAA